jgi:hypothetical protein
MVVRRQFDCRSGRQRACPGLAAQRRPGTTLVEVLVSIFVMAIGLVALLSLFPLGAFEMADAIRDNHVSVCVTNATAAAVAWDLRHDGISQPGPKTVVAMLTNPTSRSRHVDADPLGPSYPVYVDGIGYTNLLPGPNRDWIAGLNTPGLAGIPRCNPTYVGSDYRSALRWFAYLDDINFDKTGSPALVNPTAGPGARTFQRTYAYSWAYLLRRPKNAVPAMVEMWVIIYQQRPMSLKSLSTGGDELYYNVLWSSPVPVNSPKNVVTLTSQAVASADPPLPASSQSWPPPIRPGSWILDCTPGKPVGQLSSPGNARFYRVVGITDRTTSGNRLMDVEVESPIIGPSPTAPGLPPPPWPWVPAGAPRVPSRFAVLDGVIEVIYKGTNWLPQ